MQKQVLDAGCKSMISNLITLNHYCQQKYHLHDVALVLVQLNIMLIFVNIFKWIMTRMDIREFLFGVRDR